MIQQVLDNIASNFFNWGAVIIVLLGGYFFLKKCNDSGFSVGVMITGLVGILIGGLVFNQLPALIGTTKSDGENITGLKGGYNLMTGALSQIGAHATLAVARVANFVSSIR